jgi:hypothetical protein
MPDWGRRRAEEKSRSKGGRDKAQVTPKAHFLVELLHRTQAKVDFFSFEF